MVKKYFSTGLDIVELEVEDVGTKGRSVSSQFDQQDLGDCDDNYVAKLHTIPQYQVPEEFQDYLKVMEMGAKKHGADNWLNPNGAKSSFKQMHDSMFHHLAESYVQGDQQTYFTSRGDHESDLDPLLHLICRAQMMYTRLKRGIKHEND